jgi:hypothetical protein
MKPFNFTYVIRFFYIAISIAIVFLSKSCIPIEDRLIPRIEPEEPILKYYFWQDTIFFNAVMSDNDRIDEVFVEITPENPESTWSYRESFKGNGRRYDFKFRKVIPLNVLPGTYDVKITCSDRAKNRNRYSYQIEILGDIRAPQFSNLRPVNLRRLTDGRYQGCRSQVILFEGSVKDNAGLGSLTVEFEGYPRIIYNLNGLDSVNIGRLVAQDIRIPQNAADGSELKLNFICTDKDGNVSRRTFTILVDCDDVPPVLRVVRTSPMYDGNRVTVIQGTDFIIKEATASDNRFIKDFVIIFNKRGAARDTIFRENVERPLSANLSEIFGDIAVPMPSSANPGDRYDLYMFVRDSTGLSSNVFYLEVITGRDEPPLILITNTEINDIETTWSTTSPTNVRQGDRLRFDGKILEDVALEYLKISFGISANPELVVDLRENDLKGKLPFNFADVISKNVFDIPQRSTTPPYDTYSLIIETKDKKNPAVRRTYQFKVQ